MKFYRKGSNYLKVGHSYHCDDHSEDQFIIAAQPALNIVYNCDSQFNHFLIDSITRSNFWEGLHYKVISTSKSSLGFSITLRDELFTNEIINKLNTSNYLMPSPLRSFYSLHIELGIDSLTSDMIDLLNYSHLAFLIQLSLQFPLVFNFQTRYKFFVNFENFVNLSFSLLENSRLLLKFLKIIANDNDLMIHFKLQSKDLSKKLKKNKQNLGNLSVFFFF